MDMANLDLTTPFLHEVKAPSGPHKLDFVFVHGINPTGGPSHPYDTWTHPESKICWPKDLLANDLPHARIFFYGYNANVKNAELMSESRITHHADNLLMHLSWERSAAQSGTRIVFVGHSIGGLIIKQALLNAERNRSYLSIVKATFGLVFFAVPHRGANGIPLGKLAASLTNFVSNGNADNAILRSIETNSLFTQEMADQFCHHLEDYQVVSYFEQKRTRVDGGGWPFQDMTIVGEQSAVLQLPGTRELRVPVTDADHLSICRIPGRGNLYNMVLRSITRHITDKAVDSIQAYVAPPSIARVSPPGSQPLGPTPTVAPATSPSPLASITAPAITGSLFAPSGLSVDELELAEHKNMGRWGRVVEMEHSIFQERQRTLGPDHASTLDTAYNLAQAYCKLQRPKDAGPWLKWLLNAGRRLLGPDHELTMKAESMSAEVLSFQGEQGKAEEVCAQVYIRQQERLGMDHADTIETQGRLSEICFNLGRKDEAMTRLKNWVEATERVFGSNHIRTHQAELTLCEAGFSMNLEPYARTQVPAEVVRTIVQMHKNISAACSQYHPLAVWCLRLLGTWQASEGEYADSCDTLRRALSNANRDLGDEHPETIQIVLAFGLLYIKQNLWKDAAPRLQKYADWVAERRGASHDENLAVLNYLGLAYANGQEWIKAYETYEKMANAAAGVNEAQRKEAQGWLDRLSFVKTTMMSSSRRGLFGF